MPNLSNTTNVSSDSSLQASPLFNVSHVIGTIPSPLVLRTDVSPPSLEPNYTPPKDPPELDNSIALILMPFSWDSSP